MKMSEFHQVNVFPGCYTFPIVKKIKLAMNKLYNQIIMTPVSLHILFSPDTHAHTRLHTYRTEVGVLSDVAGHGVVAGRGSHDQKQGITSLLSQSSISMDKWYQQREDQQVCGTLLYCTTPEQKLQHSRLPRHGHTNLKAHIHKNLLEAIPNKWIKQKKMSYTLSATLTKSLTSN